MAGGELLFDSLNLDPALFAGGTSSLPVARAGAVDTRSPERQQRTRALEDAATNENTPLSPPPGDVDAMPTPRLATRKTPPLQDGSNNDLLYANQRLTKDQLEELAKSRADRLDKTGTNWIGDTAATVLSSAAGLVEGAGEFGNWVSGSAYQHTGIPGPADVARIGGKYIKDWADSWKSEKLQYIEQQPYFGNTDMATRTVYGLIGVLPSLGYVSVGAKAGRWALKEAGEYISSKVASKIGAGVAGGTMGAGSVAESIATAIRETPEAQLMEQNPLYKQARQNGMDDAAARDQAIRDAQGLYPLIGGAIGVVSSQLGVDRMIAAKIAGETMKAGIKRGALAGFGEEAMQEAIENSSQNYMYQLGKIKAGIQKEVNWAEVGDSGFEGFVLGGLTGGAVGGVLGRHDRKPQTVQPGQVGSDETLALTYQPAPRQLTGPPNQPPPAPPGLLPPPNIVTPPPNERFKALPAPGSLQFANEGVGTGEVVPLGQGVDATDGGQPGPGTGTGDVAPPAHAGQLTEPAYSGSSDNALRAREEMHRDAAERLGTTVDNLPDDVIEGIEKILRRRFTKWTGQPTQSVMIDPGVPPPDLQSALSPQAPMPPAAGAGAAPPAPRAGPPAGTPPPVSAQRTSSGEVIQQERDRLQGEASDRLGVPRHHLPNDVIDQIEQEINQRHGTPGRQEGPQPKRTQFPPGPAISLAPSEPPPPLEPPESQGGLYERAVAAAQREGKADTQFLSRHLRVTMPMAENLVRRMVKDKIVDKGGRVTGARPGQQPTVSKLAESPAAPVAPVVAPAAEAPASLAAPEPPAAPEEKKGGRPERTPYEDPEDEELYQRGAAYVEEASAAGKTQFVPRDLRDALGISPRDAGWLDLALVNGGVLQPAETPAQRRRREAGEAEPKKEEPKKEEPKGSQAATPTGLAGTLAGITRPSKVKGMEGETTPDPVAARLAEIEKAHPGTLAKIEDWLKGQGVKVKGALEGAFGASSVVLDASDQVVRIGEGEQARQQPEHPLVLQPDATTSINGVRVEVLPKVDTKVNRGDLAKLRKDLQDAGYNWDDAGTDNMGRLPDGSLVVIDGAVTSVEQGSVLEDEEVQKPTEKPTSNIEELKQRLARLKAQGQGPAEVRDVAKEAEAEVAAKAPTEEAPPAPPKPEQRVGERAPVSEGEARIAREQIRNKVEEKLSPSYSTDEHIGETDIDRVVDVVMENAKQQIIQLSNQRRLDSKSEALVEKLTDVVENGLDRIIASRKAAQEKLAAHQQKVATHEQAKRTLEDQKKSRSRQITKFSVAMATEADKTTLDAADKEIAEAAAEGRPPMKWASKAAEIKALLHKHRHSGKANKEARDQAKFDLQKVKKQRAALEREAEEAAESQPVKAMSEATTDAERRLAQMYPDESKARQHVLNGQKIEPIFGEHPPPTSDPTVKGERGRIAKIIGKLNAMIKAGGLSIPKNMQMVQSPYETLAIAARRAHNSKSKELLQNFLVGEREILAGNGKEWQEESVSKEEQFSGQRGKDVDDLSDEDVIAEMDDNDPWSIEEAARRQKMVLDWLEERRRKEKEEEDRKRQSTARDFARIEQLLAYAKAAGRIDRVDRAAKPKAPPGWESADTSIEADTTLRRSHTGDPPPPGGRLKQGEEVKVGTYKAKDLVHHLMMNKPGFDRLMPGKFGKAAEEIRAFFANKVVELMGDSNIEVVTQDHMRAIIDSHFGKPMEHREYAGVFLQARPGKPSRVLVLEEAGLGQHKFMTTALHEMIHAITVDAVDVNRSGAADVMRSLLEEARTALEGIPGVSSYRLSNVKEFIAGALTDPIFQQQLSKAMPSGKFLPGPRTTIWQRFVQAIQNIMGMEYAGDLGESLLTEVLQAMEGLTPSSTLQTKAWEMRSLRNRFPRETGMLSGRLTGQFADGDEMGLHANLSDPINKMADAMKAGVSWGLDHSRDFAGTDVGGAKFRIKKAALQILDTATLQDGGTKLMGEAYHRLADILRRSTHDVAKARAPGDQLAIDAGRYMRGNPVKGTQAADFVNSSTRNSIDPRVPLGAKANDHIDPKKPQHRHAVNEHTRLHALWKTFDKEQKDIVNRLDEHYRKDADERTELMVDNLLGAKFDDPGWQPPVGETRKSIKDYVLSGDIDKNYKKKSIRERSIDVALGGVGESLQEMQDVRRKRGIYVPMIREGDWVVNAVKKAPKPRGAVAEGTEDNQFRFKTADEAEAYVDTLPHDMTPRVKRVWVDPSGNVLGNKLEHDDSVPAWRVTVQTQYTSFHDTLDAANDHAEELRGDKNFEKVAHAERRQNNKREHRPEMTPHSIRPTLERIEKDSRLSESAKRMLKNSLIDSAVRSMSGHRMEHHRLHRRNVHGFVQNPATALAITNISSAHHKVNLKNIREISKLQEELKKHIKQMRYGGTAEDQLARDRYYDELKLRLEDAGGFSSPRWVNRIKTMAYTYYLASGMHSVVNMTQVPMFTYPELAGDTDIGAMTAGKKLIDVYRRMGAFGELKAGWKDTIDAMRNWGEHHQGHGTGRLIDIFRKENGKYGDGVYRMLKEAEALSSISMEAGVEFDPSQISDLGLDRHINAAARVSRALPSAVENINRFGTLVSAYELAREHKGMNHDQATAYAIDVNTKTQGDFSNRGSGRAFSNPLLAIPLQFKKFPMLAASWLARNINASLKGATPAERRSARKKLAFMAMGLMVMAGAHGLPWEPIKIPAMLALLVMGRSPGEWDEWENKAQDYLAKFIGGVPAEVMMHGVFRLFNLEMSNRLGLHSLVIGQTPKSSKEGDVWTWMGEYIVGAPGNMVITGASGVRHIAGGIWGQDMDKFLQGTSELPFPKTLRDMVAGARSYFYGKSNESGMPLATPYNAFEVAIKTFGGSPAKDARTWETGYAREKKLERQTQAEMTRLKNEWARGSGSSRDRAWAKIQKHNASVSDPDDRITMGDLRKYVRGYERRRKEAQEELEAHG